MGSKWVELLREMAPVDQKKKGGFPILVGGGNPRRLLPLHGFSCKVALGFTPHFQHIRSSEEHKKYNLRLGFGSSLFVLPFPLCRVLCLMKLARVSSI